MSDALPIVHGVGPSPFVRKVLLALRFKGVDCHLEAVMPGMVPPEFLEKSPLAKVPVWEEPGFVLPDSSAICAYLERRYPEPPLYPEDPRDYGRTLWLEEYADTKLVETTAPIFFQRVVQTRIYKLESDEKEVELMMTEQLPPVCDYLERVVAEAAERAEAGGPVWLVGERLSLADLSVVSPFVNLLHAGERVDDQRWPHLTSYLEGMFAVSEVAALVEEERELLADL